MTPKKHATKETEKGKTKVEKPFFFAHIWHIIKNENGECNADEEEH